MPTCDDYQLSFEMQLHGAAPSIDPVEITAHVHTCPVCQAYVAVTRGTETMRTNALLTTETFDADALYQRVNRELNPTLRERGLGWLAAAFVCAVFLAVWIERGRPVEDVAFAIVFGFVVVFGSVFVGKLGLERRTFWKSLAHRPAQELLAARRDELRSRRRYQLFSMILPFVLLALKLPGIVAGTKRFQGAASLDFMLVLLFALAINSVIQFRRDGRELRELMG